MQSFTSLSTVSAKKPTLTFCHCRLPQFAFYHCKHTHYLQVLCIVLDRGIELVLELVSPEGCSSVNKFTNFWEADLCSYGIWLHLFLNDLLTLKMLSLPGFRIDIFIQNVYQQQAVKQFFYQFCLALGLICFD